MVKLELLKYDGKTHERVRTFIYGIVIYFQYIFATSQNDFIAFNHFANFFNKQKFAFAVTGIVIELGLGYAKQTFL